MAPMFKEILTLGEKRGFFKLNSNGLQFGPIGYILLENLKSEWLYSNVTNRDINVFLNFSNKFSDSYDFIKDMCEEKLPFGIAHITSDISDSIMNNNMNKPDEIDQYFNSSNQLKLESLIFVPPSTSIQYFHNWQRQRRMWWRKFSASPGRYSLTDIHITPESEQSVEIKSLFAWGSHVMERIYLYPNGHSSLTKEQLQAKEARKRVQTHCVVSTTYLNKMVLNTLCDAFDNSVFQDKQRHLLRFHRKLAPYKISFAITSSNSNNINELTDLGLYLCRKLRSNNISVLLLPNSSRNTLESQYCDYDQLGIPYCVILNEGTLKTGIAYLRNRDTSLKEQIHISDLLEYVEKLFKHY